jgi:TatD DNase family protein
MFSDSHCHMDSYPPEDLERVLTGMKACQIATVLSVSIDIGTSEENIRVAQTTDSVLAAIGIHPGEAVSPTREIRKRLGELAGSTRVVAIGEIGLDFMNPSTNQDTQRELFKYQLSLAKDTNLPVVIHYSSDAHREIIDTLSNEKKNRLSGIAHGFQGTIEEMEDWLNLGFFISIGTTSLGLRNSTNSGKPLSDKVVQAIPLDSLLIETDSMAPLSRSRWMLTHKPPFPIKSSKPEEEEFRQPLDVIKVAQKIASVKKLSADEIGNITGNNLRKLLQLSHETG